MGIITAVLYPFTAFSSLQELTPTSLIPLQELTPTSLIPLRELIPCNSYSPVPKFARVTAYCVGLVVTGVKKYMGLYPI